MPMPWNKCRTEQLEQSNQRCRHIEMTAVQLETRAPFSRPRARILVCEDEIFIALAEVDLLERHGYEVVGTVDTLEDALDTCERQRPDLVLLDIRLRGRGDGVEAAKEIRRRFRIPFIFVTAHCNDVTSQRAAAAEPAGYVAKPYNEGELLTAVDRALAA